MRSADHGAFLGSTASGYSGQGWLGSARSAHAALVECAAEIGTVKAILVSHDRQRLVASDEALSCIAKRREPRNDLRHCNRRSLRSGAGAQAAVADRNQQVGTSDQRPIDRRLGSSQLGSDGAASLNRLVVHGVPPRRGIKAPALIRVAIQERAKAELNTPKARK
jgi:hypothetical protein